MFPPPSVHHSVPGTGQVLSEYSLENELSLCLWPGACAPQTCPEPPPKGSLRPRGEAAGAPYFACLPALCHHFWIPWGLEGSCRTARRQGIGLDRSPHWSPLRPTPTPDPLQRSQALLFLLCVCVCVFTQKVTLSTSCVLDSRLCLCRDPSILTKSSGGRVIPWGPLLSLPRSSVLPCRG